MEHSIVFVGGGNMATSLISGLRQADCPGDRISVIEPDAAKGDRLADDHGVQTFTQAARAPLARADVLVLSVKPQMLADVCRDLAGRLGDANPLVISIAAGVPMSAMQNWLGAHRPYVRCMPNTPSLIGAGATGLFAHEAVSESQRRLAETIMATAGITVWVRDESLLDAVTATSGSGPAYFFAFMEAIQAGAMAQGLDAADARELVLHTALGAARMAIESGDDPTTLREKVTSPGGTTQAALEQFTNGDLGALVERAMSAASRRANELAQELGDD